MKYLSIVRYILLLLGLVAVVPVFFASTEGGLSLTIGMGLMLSYILLGLAVVTVVLMSLFNVIQSPKGSMGSLVGVGMVILLAVVCYALGKSDPVVNSGGGFFTNPFELKLTDMGLYMTYVALVIAILAAVYGQIRNAFK